MTEHLLSSTEQKDCTTFAVRLTPEDKNLLDRVTHKIQRETGYKKPRYQILGEALRLHPQAKALAKAGGSDE
ncbi:MAG: hypothetical protein FWC26_02475 [Fibromonadales bacterium]|nr:hypothetical protein [Fibromonadales bacterium]